MVNFKEEIAKIIGQVLDGLTEDEISAILHLIKVMKRNRSGVT